MGRKHTVALGDHVGRLAYDAGHESIEDVWGDAQNAGLREVRSDPGVLAVGDVVFVPEGPTRAFAGLGLDQTHELVIELATTDIRIEMVHTNGTPVVHKKCNFGFDGMVHVFELDDRGRTECEIGPHTTAVTIEVREQRIECNVATLQPVDTFEGVHGRLLNLGYQPGERAAKTKSKEDYVFRSAVEEFQCDHGLSVDGVAGSKTQAKLIEVHGA